ncbi:MAG: hypothetical protein ACI9F9_003030 [Candidatus Paceibacteria bacterium]|jgi:hypothetical protein
MTRTAPVCFSLALFLLAGNVNADVLHVRGPNTDYPEIKGAVFAAQDGDLIRIWPGTYVAFGINNKALTLVAEGGPSTVLVDGTVRVRNLESSRSVTMAGVDATGVDGYGFVVSDCLGSVRISDGRFEGASAPNPLNLWNGSTGAIVTGCDDVQFSRCALVGGLPGWDNNAGYGGGGMHLGDSFIALFDCTFLGASGTTEDSPGESGYSGGDGIGCWGTGRVYAAGCLMVGGNGGAADDDLDLWTGDYGYGGNGGNGFYSGGIEAWLLDNNYQPGFGGSSPGVGHGGADGVDYSGGTPLPGDARLLETSLLLDDLSAISVQVKGTPGDVVSLRATTHAGYAFDTQLGPCLLARPFAPGLAPWKLIGQIGPSGQLQLQLPLRDLAPLGHLTLQLQARVLGSERYCTSSSATVVLDSAW